MIRTIKILICISIIIILSSCSDNISGGGTDTSNSVIMGKVIYADSSNVNGAIVKLFPSDYNPVGDSGVIEILEDTTSNMGNFSFGSLEEGIYNVYVSNPLDNQNILVQKIYISENDTTVDLKNLGIKKPGAIKIVPSDYKTFTPDYFYIPGTDIRGIADTNGFVYLINVPAAENLSVNLYSSSDGEVEIISNIKVSSNDTAFTPLRVLILVGGDTTSALTDRIKVQRQLMVDSGAVVNVGNFNEFSTEIYDTSEIDLIYCAFNVDWSSAKANVFVSLPINIASVSGEGYAKLGMIFDSVGVTYGTETEYNIMTGVNGNHPVLEGTGTSSSATTHAFENGSAAWGKTENTNTAGILIGVADQKKKYVFVYHKGDSMDVGVAPAARIALFSGDVDLGDNRSKMILWRTMLWGCGRL